MDAFEGLHSVQLSSSPPLASATNPGYEVLVSARSGIQVYSNTTFYGKPSVLEQAQKRGRAKYHSHREETKEERCEVGRLVDLEPGPIPRVEGGGQGDPRPARPQEQGTQARGREGSRLERAAQLEGARGGEHEDNVSRLRSSSLEIREKGSEILREQLDAAQKELKLKDKECERLSQIRDQLEQELEELTASLFEEAHRMVREANVKQAAAEKQLKEAQDKSDVLQAEVSALKTMVLTSTPSSPNRQAHPQLLSPGTRSRGASPHHGGGHTRNKSASGALPLSPGGHSDLPSDLQPVREDKELSSLSIFIFLFSLDRHHLSLPSSSFSFNLSISLSLPPSISLSLPPSLPPSPSLPHISFSPSLHLLLSLYPSSPSFLLSLHPSLHLSFSPSLPPSISSSFLPPLSLPPSVLLSISPFSAYCSYAPLADSMSGSGSLCLCDL
ncbi:uncharacterized protein rab3il1 isoform 9-T13 [Salvelinus alpinus]